MEMLLKIQSYLPSIRFHIWGGLGSQLFGLIAANRLREKWPNRQIALVFHTSGVTERLLELEVESLSHFKIIKKQDFRAKGFRKLEQKSASMPNVRKSKQVLKLLVHRFKLVETLNSDSEFLRLRPWLASVRGHYSGITIRQSEAFFIANLLNFRTNILLPKNNHTSIHLRLGDLLTLELKSHIPIERIANLLEVLEEDSTVTVYSDSKVDVVKDLWKSKLPPEATQFFAVDVYRTIQDCVYSKYFIGTNSKISLWVAILRLALEVGDKTYLPRELAYNVKYTLAQLNGKSTFALY